MEPSEMEGSVEEFSDTYPTLGSFLTPHDDEELEDHTILTAEGVDGPAGVAVSPEGDIQNLHADPEVESGVGEALLREAIAAGGKTLDNYDTGLTDIYRRNGFREDGRLEFDPEMAPDDWDYEEFGQPDVLFMSHQPETEYEETERYYDPSEWGQAKADSRDAASSADTETEAEPMPDNDMTTAQDVVDSAVDRKGADWVRENLERVLTPLKVMGIDASPEDVTVPDSAEE
jgi:hypothetical protein